MIGVIVNTLTVFVGSSIGLLAKKAIPSNWTSFIMAGMGLCTMYIGVSGVFEGQNTLIIDKHMANIENFQAEAQESSDSLFDTFGGKDAGSSKDSDQ